jgi:hypothetical protein
LEIQDSPDRKVRLDSWDQSDSLEAKAQSDLPDRLVSQVRKAHKEFQEPMERTEIKATLELRDTWVQSDLLEVRA